MAATNEKEIGHLRACVCVCVQASVSDSLSSIAARHKTTTSELVLINRLMTNMIFPGQVHQYNIGSLSRPISKQATLETFRHFD